MLPNELTDAEIRLIRQILGMELPPGAYGPEFPVTGRPLGGGVSSLALEFDAPPFRGEPTQGLVYRRPKSFNYHMGMDDRIKALERGFGDPYFEQLVGTAPDPMDSRDLVSQYRRVVNAQFDAENSPSAARDMKWLDTDQAEAILRNETIERDEFQGWAEEREASNRVITEKAPGKVVRSLSASELEGIPKRHWAQLDEIAQHATRRGIGLADLHADNILYDPKKGFTVIDYMPVRYENGGIAWRGGQTLPGSLDAWPIGAADDLATMNRNAVEQLRYGLQNTMVDARQVRAQGVAAKLASPPEFKGKLPVDSRGVTIDQGARWRGPDPRIGFQKDVTALPTVDPPWNDGLPARPQGLRGPQMPGVFNQVSGKALLAPDAVIPPNPLEAQARRMVGQTGAPIDSLFGQGMIDTTAVTKAGAGTVEGMATPQLALPAARQAGAGQTMTRQRLQMLQRMLREGRITPDEYVGELLAKGVIADGERVAGLGGVGNRVYSGPLRPPGNARAPLAYPQAPQGGFPMPPAPQDRMFGPTPDNLPPASRERLLNNLRSPADPARLRFNLSNPAELDPVANSLDMSGSQYGAVRNNMRASLGRGFGAAESQASPVAQAMSASTQRGQIPPMYGPPAPEMSPGAYGRTGGIPSDPIPDVPPAQRYLPAVREPNPNLPALVQPADSAGAGSAGAGAGAGATEGGAGASRFGRFGQWFRGAPMAGKGMFGSIAALPEEAGMLAKLGAGAMGGARALGTGASMWGTTAMLGTALDNSNLFGKESGLNNYGSEALKMSGLGAAVGSFFPGIGTGIGALAGAGLGLGKQFLEDKGLWPGYKPPAEEDAGPTWEQRMLKAQTKYDLDPDQMSSIMDSYRFAVENADGNQEEIDAAQATAEQAIAGLISSRGSTLSDEEQLAYDMAMQSLIGEYVRPYSDNMVRSGWNTAAAYSELGKSNPSLAPFTNAFAQDAVRGGYQQAAAMQAATQADPIIAAARKQSATLNQQAQQLAAQAMSGGQGTDVLAGL